MSSSSIKSTKSGTRSSISIGIKDISKIPNEIIIVSLKTNPEADDTKDTKDDKTDDNICNNDKMEISVYGMYKPYHPHLSFNNDTKEILQRTYSSKIESLIQTIDEKLRSTTTVEYENSILALEKSKRLNKFKNELIKTIQKDNFNDSKDDRFFIYFIDNTHDLSVLGGNGFLRFGVDDDEDDDDSDEMNRGLDGNSGSTQRKCKDNSASEDDQDSWFQKQELPIRKKVGTEVLDRPEIK